MGSEKRGTKSLVAHMQGNQAAIDELLPLVYSSLRRLAARRMRAERIGHTLQPTAVVHEAYARLVDATAIDWQGKTHFFALAAREMRYCPAWRDRRLSVKPGITGLWQVSGRSEARFHDWIQYDIEYVKRQSIGLDLQILAKTLVAVIRRSGAY